MIFFINLIYSIVVAYYIGNYINIRRDENTTRLILILLLIICPWIFLVGGQYYVGTDYPEYLRIFSRGEAELFYSKNEYIFAAIVDNWHDLMLPGQGLFYFFYSVGLLFFALTCIRFNPKIIFIFILLFICVSNLFNNQLNGLRQSIATYILTFAIVYYCQTKRILKYLLLTSVASLIHFSSIFSLIALPLAHIKLKQRAAIIIVLVSFLFSIVGGSVLSIIIDHLSFIIPPIYQHLLKSSFNTSVGIASMVPKLIWVPFVLYSTKYLNMDTQPWQNRLYVCGLLCYCLRLTSIQNIILDRLGYIFVIMAVMPLFLYWTKLYEIRKMRALAFCMFCCISFYSLKTIVLPEKEYLYQNYLFKDLIDTADFYYNPGV